MRTRHGVSVRGRYMETQTMNTKSLLLGGAVAIVLVSTVFAQTTVATRTSKTAHHSIGHHYRHVRHHIVHTVSVRPATTPAEQIQTNDLNRDQLYSAQYRTESRQYGPASQNMQGGATYYPQQPGQNTGLTPARRIPNGIAFGGATPAGGRADTPSLNSAHRE
jgi:hypothetical protein